jgi:hypothetical protein
MLYNILNNKNIKAYLFKKFYKNDFFIKNNNNIKIIL